MVSKCRSQAACRSSNQPLRSPTGTRMGGVRRDRKNISCGLGMRAECGNRSGEKWVKQAAPLGEVPRLVRGRGNTVHYEHGGAVDSQSCMMEGISKERMIKVSRGGGNCTCCTLPRYPGLHILRADPAHGVLKCLRVGATACLSIMAHHADHLQRCDGLRSYVAPVVLHIPSV